MQTCISEIYKLVSSLRALVFWFKGSMFLLKHAILNSNTLSFNPNIQSFIPIGHFHDDDIWLQLPEFISFLLSYLNLSIPLRIKEQ